MSNVASPSATQALVTAPFHAMATSEATQQLNTQTTGLDEAEARRRLAQYGPNRLPQGARRSAVTRFLLQFHNLLIYVLIAAGVLAAAIGHLTDALVIAAVVLVNATIGFIQEGRAESAMEAIRAMIDPHASVLRGGQRLTIAADEVVPGDIVLLEAGDRVPADLRLVKASSLKADEAILTGESVPVDKQVAPVGADVPLGDRFSMAYSGSFVAAGQGTGVVVATGAQTELGRISTIIGNVEQLATPLIRQMNHFARQVTVAVLGIALLVFGYAWLSDSYAMSDAFMAMVGLVVAAIPEGLPAMMTITLAIGVQRMARRNAIIRRLPAVETLGAVSVICSDKTGTLTRNEMTVTSLVTGEGTIRVDGVGYAPSGSFAADDGAALDPAAEPLLEELALAGLLCNDAALRQVDGRWIVDGDPMEGALVSLARKAGHDDAAARTGFARIAEIPFDARHRYMATLNLRTGHPP
ncbi:MAG TPA: HAD-IC family P-type ATPase, partial [Erythrobacter sp.]|nr:HAD-IC family P-type ATPase [Erythrobacter sp.]